MKQLDIETFEKYSIICGVDEVGRGSLIGSVVACAVVFSKEAKLDGVDDSKKISKIKRHKIDKIIRDQAICFSFGEASIDEIDQLNIYEATKIAMIRAIEKLEVQPEFILIDAMPLDIPNSISPKKGDEKSTSIGAASILAKNFRDEQMNVIAQEYPEYDFENNKGYLTKRHREALLKFGVTRFHRKSFEPVKSMLKNKGR